MTTTAPRLIATTARALDRHNPAHATLRTYHRHADTIYWEDSPTNMEQMGTQVARLDAIREPLARAARALRNELGMDYLLLADDLTNLWTRPDVGQWIGGDFIYRIGYVAYLLMGYVEDMQEAVVDPEASRVLGEHLVRPVG